MRKQRRAAKQSGGGGGLLTGVLALAVVGGGGFWLYRHTMPAQRGEGEPAARATSAGATAEQSVRPAPAPVPPLGGEDVAGSVGMPAVRPAGAAAGAAAGADIGTGPVPQAPFGESEEVFETGAKVYGAHCASCHGRPGHVASAHALQLWDGHAAAVKEMAARPPGALYLQIAHGVPASNGMPAMAGYQHVLSETEMWDVALLLRNAGQELPDPVMHLLERSGR